MRLLDAMQTTKILKSGEGIGRITQRLESPRETNGQECYDQLRSNLTAVVQVQFSHPLLNNSPDTHESLDRLD